MANDLINRLRQIQNDARNNYLNPEKLKELKEKAKRSFDERIDQLIANNNLVRKIRIPKLYINLWRHRGKRLQIAINLRYLVSSPFIYGMIIPSVIWHIGIEIYHQICFRLYGIPRVRYQEYFVNDRQLLSWLNPWEKMNCIYCSYVNSLIRYSAEIGGRTERYWCPIKYYRRLKNPHSQYDKFVEKKDPVEMRKQWEELRDFSDLV